MDAGFVKLLSDFLWNQSLRWILTSVVTFGAVLLWFTGTILFNVWRSISLGFGFRPLFLLADDVLPWFVYVTIILETAALDTPNKVTVSLQVLQLNMHQQSLLFEILRRLPFCSTYKLLLNTICNPLTLALHSTNQPKKRKEKKNNKKDTTNVLSVQPTQTLFLYCLVFPLCLSPVDIN